MPACSICSHEKRSEIELAVANGVSNRRVASQYGVSEASIRRHLATHIKQAARELTTRIEQTKTLDVIAELQNLYHRMSGHLDRIEQAKNPDWQAIRAFHAEVRRDLELLGRFSGVLDERPQVTVLMTAEWQATRSAILQALIGFPEARMSVASALAELEQSNHARLN